MAPTRHPLTQRRHGFTLTEVLVALSLVAVVGTLALLLLNTTGQVAAEIERDLYLPKEAILVRLETDLLQLVPLPEGELFPEFSLEDGNTLSFTTLLATVSGTQVPVACTYIPDGPSTLRIVQDATGVTTTNRLDTLLTPLRFEVKSGDQWSADWPPEESEDASEAPLLLRVRGKVGADGLFSHLLPLPAHLRVEPETSTEASDDESDAP